MNKEEFLTKLRKRLDILEDREIEDIISEYESYIDEKVTSGKSEEEAVKELGDFEEIVSDLLSAYKLKSKQTEENSFTKFINKVSKGLDIFIDNLSNKSAKDIIKILIEIVIILFIICLFKIPFAMIKDLGSDIFRELSNPIGNIFSDIWCFLIDLSYIIVAIVFFIKIFEKRYFKDFTDKLVDGEVENDSTPSKKENKKKEINHEVKTNKKINVVNEEKVHKHDFIDSIANLCILFLKLIVMCILIGIIFYLIGISVAFGLMIYLICHGVQYYGVLILIIALFMAGAFFLEWGIHFCFNKKIKAYSFFLKLIMLIIITGIGLTWSAIEMANTEIIYENYYQKTKSVTKVISMTDDISLYNYDKIIIDNNLEDTIKIEYVYPDLHDNLVVNIDLENHGNEYFLHTDIQNMKWSKEFLNTVIENLKNRKIYTYDFYIEKIVYISEANYNILMNNNNKEISTKPTYVFTQTFNVLNVSESSDYYYLYLTIRQYQEEEIHTVKVLRSLASEVEVGNNYEFTFENNGNDNFQSVQGMFEQFQLIEIRLTDKVGMEQIQESPYSPF